MWKGNLQNQWRVQLLRTTNGCVKYHDNIQLYAFEFRLKWIGETTKSLYSCSKFSEGINYLGHYFSWLPSQQTPTSKQHLQILQHFSSTFIYLFIPPTPRRLCWAFTSNLDFWLGVKIDLLHLPPQHQQGMCDVWYAKPLSEVSKYDLWYRNGFCHSRVFAVEIKSPETSGASPPCSLWYRYTLTVYQWQATK